MSCRSPISIAATVMTVGYLFGGAVGGYLATPLHTKSGVIDPISLYFLPNGIGMTSIAAILILAQCCKYRLLFYISMLSLLILWNSMAFGVQLCVVFAKEWMKGMFRSNDDEKRISKFSSTFMTVTYFAILIILLHLCYGIKWKCAKLYSKSQLQDDHMLGRKRDDNSPML